MSESKSKRGTSSATNGPGKAAADATNFGTKLRKLSSELESLWKETDGVKEYGQLHDEHTTLRQHLEGRNREIQALKQERDGARKQSEEKIAELEGIIADLKKFETALDEKYNAKFKAWDADISLHKTDSIEMSRLMAELTACRSESAKIREKAESHAHERNRTAITLQQQQDDIYSLQTKYKSKASQLQETQDELRKCRDTLNEREQELGLRQFENAKLKRNFEDLAARSAELVHAHFAKDIRDVNTSIGVLGTPLRLIPLVASNSVAAKLARSAFAEAVIAQALERHIFRVAYIPDAAGAELNGLLESLAWLSEKCQLEASIIRCQLARACHKLGGTDTATSRANESVYKMLRPWLDDEKARESFSTGLKLLLSDATKLWRDVQQSGKHAVASPEATVEWVDKEDCRPTYGPISGSEGQDSQHVRSHLIDPIAVLFPQIWIGQNMFFHGFALFSTQQFVMAAMAERSSHPIPSPVSRRRMSQPERREQLVRDGRRLSNASSDAPQRSVPGMASDLSYSGRTKQRTSAVAADAAPSVTSSKG